MNTELFIARRILKGEQKKNRLSRPIVVISLISIILGLAIMIITVSVVTGFQDGIRNKVIGFGSHIQVTSMDANNSMESSPMLLDQPFYPSIEERENVRKIQPFAYKPGIVQHKRDSIVFESKEEIESSVDLLGVLFKGVDQNYDWGFFDDKLVDGRLINFDESNDEVMISSYIQQKMGYDLGDSLDVYFIQNKPKPRSFEIVGVYETGFEQFDKQFIYTQIHHIQKLNNWGVRTTLTLADTCIDNQFVLEARTSGGNGNYKYSWGKQYVEVDQLTIDERFNNRTIAVSSSDYKMSVSGRKTDMISVPDTAFVKLTIDSTCNCTEETLAQVEFKSREEIILPGGRLDITNGNGTHEHYTGGFEIMINDWSDLEEMDEIIREEIPYGEMDTTKITDLHPDIFAWLSFLDINIVIIIVLILIVSLMNMVTSLLVLILEKTNMIGILKAMGATNASIRKIFLYNSIFLLGRGMLWGNILGIGLILIQYFFGVMKLDPEVYYLDTVPVSINIWHLLAINGLTLLACRYTLRIPSILISRIKPTKAIKFD